MPKILNGVHIFMNLKHIFLSLLPVVALLGLAGCAHYKAKPLTKLQQVNGSAKASAQDESVTMTYEVFTKEDCKKYLDRDVQKKGYQPIHIAINNNTNSSFIFSTKNISIHCVDNEEVAEQVHTNTVARVVWYSVFGLFLPAIIDGFGSEKANRLLDADFSHKELQDQVIMPYHTIDGLIFIDIDNVDSLDNLTITLLNKEDRSPFIIPMDSQDVKSC